MRTWLRRLAVVALLPSASVGSSTALAGVPAMITEQGRAFDAGGNPIVVSTPVTFTLYASIGGAPLWTETQVLPFDEGYFSAALGAVSPLPASAWDGSARYVGITVGADPEMAPYQITLSVPYALASNDLLGDIHPTSVTVGGTLDVDASGAWVGPTDGILGPTGPAGDAGAAGPVGPTGAAGAAGPIGPAGAVGAQGLAGATGPAGPQGSAGAQGPAGAAGAVGPAGGVGPQGPVGVTGPQGPVGPLGPTGPTGSPGATGPMGPMGAQGPTGPNGATGSAGPAGATGAPGGMGPTGSAGATGSVGPNGSPGSAGSAGPDGPAGPTGATGATGPVGATGTRGPTGATGATGAAGNARTTSVSCGNATSSADGSCSCAIRTESSILAPAGCNVTSNGGSCSATAFATGAAPHNAACCVCANN